MKICNTKHHRNLEILTTSLGAITPPAYNACDYSPALINLWLVAHMLTVNSSTELHPSSIVDALRFNDHFSMGYTISNYIEGFIGFLQI